MSVTELYEARRLIAKVGAMMLHRNLTDLAGGNISLRVGDRVVMSPTYAGARCLWQLDPEQVLVMDLDGNKLDGEGDISREAPTHLKLLRSFYPVGQAVIHAHPRNTLVFCAAEQSIPPVLEGTLKFGEIQLARYANGGTKSEQLAENIFEALCGQEAMMARQAAVVLAPWHGVFAIGNDLLLTLDAVDRVETNAYCILMGKALLADADRLDAHRLRLADAVNNSVMPGGE